MSETDRSELVETLKAALHHSKDDIRAGAAIALGRIGGTQAVEPLARNLDDPAHRVRRSTARALGMLGNPAIGTLLNLIQAPPTERAQEAAGLALGQVSDREAIPLLCAALGYPEPHARSGAALALRKICSAKAVPALLEAVRHSDVATRRAAVSALAEIGDRSAKDALTTMLSEPDDQIRSIAVGGLGRIGTEAVLIPILAALHDENPQVQWEAAEALGTIRDLDSIELLLSALEENSTFIRQSIVEALGRIGHPDALEPLFQLADDDPDLQVRLSASQSLVMLGDERGRQRIARTFNAPNSNTRRLAAIALGFIGDSRSTDTLVESGAQLEKQGSTPQERHLRVRVIAALGSLGPEIVPALLKYHEEGSTAIKRAAHESLVAIGAPASGPLVGVLNNHSDPSVRARALQILVEIGDPGAVPAIERVLVRSSSKPHLLRFLQTLFFIQNRSFQLAALRALGELGQGRSAQPILEIARFDPDPEIRKGAFRALSVIGQPDSIGKLAGVDVYSQAIRAMTSGVMILALGAIVGLMVTVWGVPEFAVLAGLVIGSVFGISDGLESHQKPFRGGIIGLLLALAINLVLYQIQPVPTTKVLISVLPIVLSLVGLGLGRVKVTFIQRLAGLFGGAILGFLGSILAIFILSGLQS